MDDATITCPLTPTGEGGISVIEVAGPGAARIIGRLFVSPRRLRVAEMTPGQLLYGKLWRSGELLDEVVLECVELGHLQTFAVNCHGGAIASRRVLDALAGEGAERVSVPELLARRQRMERFDRIRREAAELLPAAPTRLAVRVVLDQYHGALSDVLAGIRKTVDSGADWEEVRKELERLIETARFGRGLFEHARVVIAGRPNVGKSTLANVLLRFDRMIIHRTPGTTRDTIEEVFSIRGVPFLLVDTAGLGEARCIVEQESVRRGREEITRADVLVLVFDGASPLRQEDHQLLEDAPMRRTVPVINKCDLPRVVASDEISSKLRSAPVEIAAAHGMGIQALEDRILDTAYPKRPDEGGAVVFTERQERHIRVALAAAEARDGKHLSDRLDRLVTEG